MTRLRLISLVLAVAGCQPADRIAIPATDLARSPDGRLVAFVRPTPGQFVRTTSLEDQQATELWVAEASGLHPRRLVVGHAADSVEQAIAAMQSPVFSPDGGRIYFLSIGWATSGAIHAVEVEGGGERFVAAGNSLEVIPRGTYAGCLLVEQHRYRSDSGPSFDALWLLTGNGRVLSMVADDTTNDEPQRANLRKLNIPSDSAASAQAAHASARCTT